VDLRESWCSTYLPCIIDISLFVDLHESWCSTHLPCVIDISKVSVRHSVKLRASFGVISHICSACNGVLVSQIDQFTVNPRITTQVLES
jgi:hypothetical protein